MGVIKTYGCIGEHLTHSFSKEIHAEIGDYDYQIQELTPDEVGPFMQKHDFLGINVTIPYKQTVIPYLDEIDEAALRIHAVNTIVNRNGKLYGYNTDFGGMTALIQRAGIQIQGKKVLILGTGGTSKTAVEVVRALGACSVHRVSRSGNEDAITYEEARNRYADTEILVNTTPCGMYPNIWDAPVRLEDFPGTEGVVDAIYNPLRSILVSNAARQGIKATGGLYMLVAQAVLASEHFLGIRYGADKTENVFNTIYNDKQNIVLVGMPACGKTTVGRALAGQLGFTFIDTDEELEKNYRMKIPDIFARYGESVFRDWESETVRKVSASSHCVIATGGGAVLRRENVDALKHNGRLFFLNRPLNDLIPTKDRPTANSVEAIRKRFEERYPIYTSVADETVTVTGIVQDAVSEILAKRENRR